MAKGVYKEWIEKDGLIKLSGWARDGLTDEQIAHNMGIHVSTLYAYKNKYPEIDEALKRSKEVIDMEVESSLLKRALGYTITLRKQKVTRDGLVVDVEEEVHYPPEVLAQIFWLKNRKPKYWRDKVIEEASEDKLNKVKELLDKLDEEAKK